MNMLFPLVSMLFLFGMLAFTWLKRRQGMSVPVSVVRSYYLPRIGLLTGGLQRTADNEKSRLLP